MKANILKITLHNQLVGYLAGFSNSKNVFVFADEFRFNANRPTLSLITHPQFATATKVMAEPWARKQKLHPVFSNLLPEGVLRELFASALKVHPNNEFQLLAYLGQDLPGAIVAEPLSSDAVPTELMTHFSSATAVVFEDFKPVNKFSLAGVQMKFSMKQKEQRYNFAHQGELGDWIIKTPSTVHKEVPLNEYTAMRLAELAGVNIPKIQLVPLGQLDGLPPINLPNEEFAFAIQRFDRLGNQRIHMEDFAQVLVKYPHDKYQGGNYEQLGRILLEYSQNGLLDVQQLARRMLVNILLANGDAHLKNWSLFYPDQVNPVLSPAYDILSTHVYIQNEQEFSLNLNRKKQWYATSFADFQQWAKHVGVPWQAIKLHLDDVLDKARTLWPNALDGLPMNDAQKVQLRLHWSKLHKDFLL